MFAQDVQKALVKAAETFKTCVWVNMYEEAKKRFDRQRRWNVLTGHCARASYSVPLLVEPTADARWRTGARSLVPNNHNDTVGYVLDRRIIMFSRFYNRLLHSDWLCGQYDCIRYYYCNDPLLIIHPT